MSPQNGPMQAARTVRTRVPQLAEAATARARLALVPARQVDAPRTPFAILLLSLLGLGVVGLLMFNTHMQQNAFAASALQQRAEALRAEQQGLGMELQQLRDPQRVALEARRIGMVMPTNPAFLQLSSGRIQGKAVPATQEGALFVRNFPAVKPAALAPRPRVITVRPKKPAGAATAPTGTGTGASGRASAESGAAAGRNGTSTPAPGSSATGPTAR